MAIVRDGSGGFDNYQQVLEMTTRHDSIKLLIAALKSLEDGAVDAKEGALICRLIGDLLESLLPLIKRHRLGMVLRVSIYGIRSMLIEAAENLEGVKGDD